MRKFIISIITLTLVAITSFINIQNLNNKVLASPNMQLQFIINNEANNINPISNGVWFYLDISVSGHNYNDDNFINITKWTYTLNYKDVFTTVRNTSTTIITIDITQFDTLFFNFTFGTFYSPTGIMWYHTQLTAANNYVYNQYAPYKNNGNNGTQLIINAYGGDCTNSANWIFKSYKV